MEPGAGSGEPCRGGSSCAAPTLWELRDFGLFFFHTPWPFFFMQVTILLCTFMVSVPSLFQLAFGNSSLRSYVVLKFRFSSSESFFSVFEIPGRECGLAQLGSGVYSPVAGDEGKEGQT